jgi:hypothetical protein
LALGVTPLRVGQEAYWLDQMARDRCEYYSGKGSRRAGGSGPWLSAWVSRGSLTRRPVHRLFAGQDPLTGEQRVAPLWRADPAPGWTPGPLQALLRDFAASRGVVVSELVTGERGAEAVAEHFRNPEGLSPGRGSNVPDSPSSKS